VAYGGAALLNEPGLSGAEIVRQYQRRVHALLYRMIGRRSDVEDLCQETFLQLLRNPGALRAARDRNAWVYRVAMNVAADFLRRKVRDRQAPGAEPAVRDAGSAALDPESVARRALDELPIQLRQVVLLRVFEEMSHDEIAAVVDATVGTVRWRLFEARRQLGEKLGPYLKDMKEDQP
jgi:RNA polymerase sigma-70 factor (ECF subfamily)